MTVGAGIGGVIFMVQYIDFWEAIVAANRLEVDEMVSPTQLSDIEVARVKRTTYGGVSQFEGITTDNRPVYVRLRHGELTVRIGVVGGSVADAIAETPVFDDNFGDDHEFDITWPEIEQVTGIRCVGVAEDYLQR